MALSAKYLRPVTRYKLQEDIIHKTTTSWVSLKLSRYYRSDSAIESTGEDLKLIHNNFKISEEFCT